METVEKSKKMQSHSGLIFIGCMFLGAAIGMLCDKTDVGGAIGMGAGFLAMGIIKMSKN